MSVNRCFVEIILSIGVLIGVALLLVVARRIDRWTRVQTVLAPVAFALFGFAPAVVLRVGLIESTGVRVLFALTYFFLFSIVGSLLLNGKVARERTDHV